MRGDFQRHLCRFRGNESADGRLRHPPAQGTIRRALGGRCARTSCARGVDFCICETQRIRARRALLLFACYFGKKAEWRFGCLTARVESLGKFSSCALQRSASPVIRLFNRGEYPTGFVDIQTNPGLFGKLGSCAVQQKIPVSVSAGPAAGDTPRIITGPKTGSIPSITEPITDPITGSITGPITGLEHPVMGDQAFESVGDSGMRKNLRKNPLGQSHSGGLTHPNLPAVPARIESQPVRRRIVPRHFRLRFSGRPGRMTGIGTRGGIQ